VADAAGLDLDQRLAAAGLGHVALDQLEIAAGLRDLNRSHPVRHLVHLSSKLPLEDAPTRRPAPDAERDSVGL
jgi:hypothetical protein